MITNKIKKMLQLQVTLLHSKLFKTQPEQVKPTNPSIQMSCKGQSSFRIPRIVYAYWASKAIYGPTIPTSLSPNVLQRPEQFWNTRNSSVCLLGQQNHLWASNTHKSISPNVLQMLNTGTLFQ